MMRSMIPPNFVSIRGTLSRSWHAFGYRARWLRPGAITEKFYNFDQFWLVYQFSCITSPSKMQCCKDRITIISTKTTGSWHFRARALKKIPIAPNCENLNISANNSFCNSKHTGRDISHQCFLYLWWHYLQVIQVWIENEWNLPLSCKQARKRAVWDFFYENQEQLVISYRVFYG